MFKNTILTVLITFSSTFTSINHAFADGCKISIPQWESNLPVDTLSKLLQSAPSCPGDVLNFKNLLAANGYSTAPSIVANQGFHNPTEGSFSFFEMVSGAGLKPGDFSFGHFSQGNANGVLSLAQAPSPGALMIELIVWDKTKQAFNFYELIGAGSAGKWFYRGNSFDIIDDTENLFASRNAGVPAFGNKLRCSGCHVSGGPILKETDHQTDWWKIDRKLPLGDWTLNTDVKRLFETSADASQFASGVDSGRLTLENSTAFQTHRKSKSLQSQLRPLFCDEEVELDSDEFPLDNSATTITIPSRSLVFNLLGAATIKVSKQSYLNALSDLGSQFPGTQRTDADHAWMVPIKGTADDVAIQQLLLDGRVDKDFVYDVLAVDFENPVMSEKRCELLKLVPKQISASWKDEFVKNLAKSTKPWAADLVTYIQGDTYTPEYHRAQAANYLAEIPKQLSTEQGLKNFLMTNVFAKRAAVFNSELSSNPLGQIFEPGFRVIFPRIR